MKLKKQSIKQSKIKTTDVSSNNNIFDYPVFSFKNMQNGNYHLDSCEKDEKAKLVSKLAKIGQFSWVELQSKGRKQLGYEKIHKNSIKKASTDFLTDDVQLIAFRAIGEASMVGYRCNKGAFHILWIDRDFILYPH